MIGKAIDAIRAGLPENASPEVLAALARPHSTVVLGSRWEGRVVLGLFAPRGKTPAVVVKSDTNKAYKSRLRQEHEALRRVAADPGMKGIAPAPLGVYEFGDTVVMAQTGLTGTPLNVVLRRRYRHSARRSARDHARFRAWLEIYRGHAFTNTVTVDPEVVLRRLSEVLPADAPGAAELTSWVAEVGADLGALELPVRNLHGDLAPSNCFVDRGRIRVVDWEGAVSMGPPLAETLLFLNHYARAVPGPGTQLREPTDTFREAFIADGWLSRLTWNTWREELHSLGQPAEADRYLFVATLIDLAGGHAATAHAKRKGSQRNWTTLLQLYAEQCQGSHPTPNTVSPSL